MLYKLKCGNEEINLTDWTTFYPLKGGLADDGETVTLRLYVQESCYASAAITNWLHRIHQLSQRAVEYETAMIGQPVMLGCKVEDGNPYDTTLGRGWYYKYLLGTSTQDAIEVNPTEQWDNSLHQGYISELTLVFHTKPRIGYDGTPIYMWEPLYSKWVGCFQDLGRLLDNGGIFCEDGTTNLLPNSDFENEADRYLNWSSGVGLLIPTTTEEQDVYNGFAAMKLTNPTGGARAFFQTWNAGEVSTYCLSFYVKRLDGGAVTSADCVAYYGAALATTFEADPKRAGWYRAYATFTSVNAAASIGVDVKAGKSVIVDSFQLEEFGYPTTLAYGDMGDGYTWSGGGTPHQVASVRSPGLYAIHSLDSNIARTYPVDKATVLVVWEVPYATALLASTWVNKGLFSTGAARELLFINSATGLRFTDGVTAVDSGALVLDKGDIVFAFARTGPSGISLRVYINNVIAASVSNASYTPPADSASTMLIIGNNDLEQDTSCGKVLETQIWHEELTNKECDDRTQCGVGNGEFPYIVSGTAYISLNKRVSNSPANANLNTARFSNFPGDAEAGLQLFFEMVAGPSGSLQYIYMGQMRRGVPRQELASKHLLVGNFCDGGIEAEDGSSSYDADTSTVVDADCSGGNKARTIASDIDEHLRIKIPVCNEPEDLWKYTGRLRLLPRAYCAVSETARARFRVITGGQAGDYTEQVYLDGDSVWRPVTPTKLIVDIPSLYISPDALQQYKPGDWDASVDGPFCYLEYYLQVDVPGTVVDLDCVVLLPQDQEGWAIVDNDNWIVDKSLTINTCGHEFAWDLVYDESFERHVDGFDWSGQRFTAPPHTPFTFVFMLRGGGIGFPWLIDDSVNLYAKYKPRYRRVR